MVALFYSEIVSEFPRPGHCPANWKEQYYVIKSESSELCLKPKLDSDLTGPALPHITVSGIIVVIFDCHWNHQNENMAFSLLQYGRSTTKNSHKLLLLLVSYT